MPDDERTARAHRFCRDVLAGRDPGPLPAEDRERARLLDLLRTHKLLGLWLAEHHRAGRPEGLRPADEAAVALQAFQARLTMEAADRAVGALRTAGYDALLFKGAALVRRGCYGDPRARALGDADVLVRESHADAAIACLEGAGFRPWLPWNPDRLGWLPAFTLDDASAPPGLDVTIDLHWRIPYGSYRSGPERRSDALWDGRDEDRALPADAIHAVLLAAHFVRHLRVVPHLSGLADLVRLLPRIEDPERVEYVARRRDSHAPLRAVLWLLREELDVGGHDALRRALGVPERPTFVQRRALDLDRLLLRGQDTTWGRIDGIVAQASLEGSVGDLAREIARVAYPSAWWLDQRYRSTVTGRRKGRLAYTLQLVRWLAGRDVSPLSPNQEFELPSRSSRPQDRPDEPGRPEDR